MITAPNKALVRTQIPLRFFCVGQLGRFMSYTNLRTGLKNGK